MSCQHREDVCQHCLEKVQTTTEDSPPKIYTTDLGAKIVVFPFIASFVGASGVIWAISTKLLYKAGKVVWEYIKTPTE